MKKKKTPKKRPTKYDEKVVLKDHVTFDDLLSASVGKPPVFKKGKDEKADK